MTEERSCKTCGLSSSNNVTVKLCQYLGETCNDYNYYSKWQPIAQEKPMENKVIFESEEQLRKFVDDCIFIDEDENNMDDIVQYARIGNYIRKTAVEEAEEEYRAYKEGKNCFVAEIVMDKMYVAIQELKSEIARLKK